MRKFISVMILMIGLFVSMSPGNQVCASSFSDQTSLAFNNNETAPAVLAQEEGGVASLDEPNETLVPKPVEEGNFFLDNWGALLLGLLAFYDLVARLTPSEKDNSIVNFLLSIFNAIIPNLKKGGGSFRLLSK